MKESWAKTKPSVIPRQQSLQIQKLKNVEDTVGLTGDGMDLVGGPMGAGPPFQPRLDLHQQAKSLQLLQELQNEVGALLEFRDVVMEAFPQLKHKIRSNNSNGVVNGSSGSGSGSGGLGGSSSSRWEPGVRVRRQRQGGGGGGAGASVASGTNGGNGVSSTSNSNKDDTPRSRSNSRSTVVQDSGFSTADSSGTTATGGGGVGSSKKHLPPEDELWALLEIIQAKGTRLRLEVESLKGSCWPSGTLGVRSRSLGELQTPSVPLSRVIQERDDLCIRVSELENENLERASAAAALSRRVSELQEDKRRLEGELTEARGGGPLSQHHHHPHNHSPLLGEATKGRSSSSPSLHPPSYNATPLSASVLGRLDGLVSSPSEVIPCPKGVVPDREVMAAILKESNVVELQRHLITSVHRNQVTETKLEKALKSRACLAHQLEKAREEIDDLRFQVEEKKIELEGTRARVRLLERVANSKQSLHDSSAGEDNSSTESGGQCGGRSVGGGGGGGVESTDRVDDSGGVGVGGVGGCERETLIRPSVVKVPRPSKIPLKSYKAPPNSLVSQSKVPAHPTSAHHHTSNSTTTTPTSTNQNINNNKLSFFNWLRLSSHQ